MKKKFIIEQLEERLMLSADFLPVPFDGGLPYDEGTADLAVVETPLFPNASESHNVENAELQRHELVFIDSGVSEYQKLVDDIMAKKDNGTHFEVIVLDSSRDGIDQISGTLNNYANIDAVHLFSHGSDGAVQLGNTWLTLDTLDTYADSIEAWKNSLTGDADLLFYGCDVASGESGQAFVESLGILTGADIAASDDLTGVKELGGDWELEVTSGRIETIELHASYAWQGILDLVNVNAAADTYIDNGESSKNYGNSPSLIVDHSGGDIGDQRILMQFDLSGVPAGSTINGATLKMNATGNTGAFDINIYALTEAWVEGTGNGTSGVASWDQRQSGTNWTTAGGDYDDLTIYSTLNTTAFGQHTWDISSLVQAWYGGTIANHGLIIGSPDGGGESVTYDSDEKGTGIRPVLEINYTPPAGNTQPILDNSANLALNSVAEDAGVPSVGDGTLISDLVDLVDGSGHDNVTDPDSGAVTGIALTNVDTSNGTWYYSTDNGNNWALISDVVDPATIAPNNAFVLAADGSTRIYFRPNADYTGTISNAIKFRSWDQTDGLASGDIADTTPSSAYSSTPEQAEITVDPVNDAPVVTAPGSALSATEQTALNIHGPAMFSVSDVDAASSGVMATLSVGEGTLTIAEGDSGVIINGGNGTGTVVISGTISQINALLTGASIGTITYLNNSETPSASTTLTVTVNDQGNTGTDPGLTGNATSEEGSNSVTINITADNDPPSVSATASDTGTEDTDKVYTHAEMLTLIGASDVDDVNANLSISITNVVNGTVALSGGTGGAGTTFTFTPTLNFVGNMTFDYQVADDDSDSSAVGTATVALSADNDAPGVSATASDTGTEDTDQVYTHAEMLTLIGASDVDDVNANLSISITNVVNGTVALSGGTGGAGTTFTFTPTLNFVGNMTFDYQVADDDSDSSAVGTATVALSADNDAPGVSATASDTGTEDTDQVYTHAEMLTLIGASDVDDVNANLSISITNVVNGTVALSGGTGGAGTTFTFTPTLNFVGNMTFDYQVSDDDSALSAVVGTATVALSADNDAPQATASTVITNEDTAYTFKEADFTFTDVESNSLVSVTITNLNLGGGTLKLSGVDVNNGDIISAANIGNLVYTPADDANGAPLATFDFTVNDADLGTVSAQMDIDVSAQNDAPQATANTVSTSEDNPYTFKAADFTFTDMESNSLVSVTITNQNLGGGTLQLSGMNVNNGDTISAANIGNLVYTPAGDVNGAALATFDFTVNDADPGTIAARMGIDVLSVADTPAVSNTGTLPETLSDPIVISPNASDGVEVTHFQITGITNGTLYHADGTTPIHNGDYITLTQAQDGLKFQLASNTANGSFNVRPSKNGFSVDPDSGSATPIITVLSSSTVPDAGDTGDEPAEDDQEIKEETIADNPLNDATGNNATLSYNTAQKKSFITSDASVPKSGVYESQVTVDFKPIMERLSRIQESDSSNILSALSLEQQFNNIINKLPDFRTSYENLKNALDDFRKEADEEMQDSETVIGSAIAVSTGLSVGYVIWMIRGGMLLSSLISSMPAWQLADPLPILKNSNNDEDDEDDESLETIIKNSSDNDDKKKQDPDKTGN